MAAGPWDEYRKKRGPWDDYAPTATAEPQRSAAELGAEAAASEYGPMQAGLVAAGRTLDRLYQGGKQMALQVPAAMGRPWAKDTLAKMEQEQANNTEAYAALEKQNPIATTIGGAAPLLAAPILGAGAVGMAGSAALPGLIEYGNPTERLQRGAMGAAGGLAGAGLAKGLERFLRPVQTVPDAARVAATQAAERIGYQVPVGQQTGSRTLQAIEQQLAKNPFSGPAAQRAGNANQEALNSAAARAMGESAPSLTDDVLNAAKSRIGGQFDALAARNTVDVTGPDLLNALVVLDTKQQELGAFGSKKVASLIDKGLDLASRGQVSGTTYQVIRSELGSQAEKAFNGRNASLGEALKTVQRALDTAANSSISAADKAAWNTARAQYTALKLASKRGNVVEGGNVSAARLSSKIDKQRGDIPQELRDIGAIGETFKPLADSGTASNSMVQALISGGAGLLGPVALGTTIAAPMATQKFLQSKVGQKYLTQGIASLTPYEKRLLELSGAGLLSSATPAMLAQ